jgi:hypothetical protein
MYADTTELLANSLPHQTEYYSVSTVEIVLQCQQLYLSLFLFIFIIIIILPMPIFRSCQDFELSMRKVKCVFFSIPVLDMFLMVAIFFMYPPCCN